MMKINHNDLKGVCRAYIDSKTALFIWGAFGVGKSAIIKQVSEEIAKEKNLIFLDWNKTTRINKDIALRDKEKYYFFIDVRLSEYDTADIKGIPNLNGEVTRWNVTEWAKILTEQTQGLLFLDEINLASPMVMASAYKIIYDRIIGENAISDGWGIIGAGNRDNDKAYTHSLPAPIKDRGGEVELIEPTSEDWINWAISKDIDARIISFLNFKNGALFVVNHDDGQKYTTPRGWERVSNLIKGKELNQINLLVKSAIGEGVACEFLAFCKIEDKKKFEDILKNPSKIKEIKEISERYLIIGNIAERYGKDKVTFKFIEEISLILDDEGLQEYVTILWRFCNQYDKEQFKKDIIKSKEIKLLTRYAGLL
jgi:DNA-binding Lrp family transcriptional regulator